MVDERPSPAWLALAFGRDRQYAGNAGYEDDTARYGYDSNVPNHTRVAAGDVLAFCDRVALQAFARIASIKQAAGHKRRLRCPVCRTSAIKKRETRQPTFRCDQGHEFQDADEEQVDVTLFTAELGDSYLPARGSIPLVDLRAACPRWNGQLAIQSLDLTRLAGALATVPGFDERIRLQRPRPALAAHEGSEYVDQSPYAPRGNDTRSVALREIRERRGQSAFRREPLTRHSSRCLISGCTLADVLEAAHVRPYRGSNDHHVENGLLLRADLHTLFDLDLLGIHPEKLTVHLHRSVSDAGYAVFDGQKLLCAPMALSRSALDQRWSEFLLKAGPENVPPVDRKPGGTDSPHD